MPSELTNRSKILWGKLSSKEKQSWLPLYVHMSDSCMIGMKLWDEWVSESIKKHISKDIPGRDSTNFIGFLCAIHDIGKATPAFQTKKLREKGLEN